MSEDSKDNAVNANFGLSESFNRNEKLARDIASLSPAAKETCRAISEVSEKRMEHEKKNQQRYHAHRVLKTKVELLEKYVMDPLEHPPEFRAADLKIIDEQAERMVKEKEEFYLRTIEREAEANLRQVVAMDQLGHDFSAEQQIGDPEMGE
jgi:serine phosphatase RsbU (regulator of sigma subunit)